MFSPTYNREIKWRGCRECNLHRTRGTVVLSRTGTIGISPRLRTLCIGEAPGETEDRTGYPFVGKAGRILNLILDRVTTPTHYCITNLVACRPPGNREPTPPEIEICSPKLHQLQEVYQPHCIVYIGKTARAFKTKLPTHLMLHPAVITRLEYPLVPVKEQALLLSRFLNAVLNNKDRKSSLYQP